MSQYVSCFINISFDECIKKYNARIHNGDKLSGVMEELNRVEGTVKLSGLTKCNSEESIDIVVDLEDLKYIFKSDPKDVFKHIYIWTNPKVVDSKGRDLKPPKPNYTSVFKCDNCQKLLSKEETVFTQTSQGGRAWLCEPCAVRNGINNPVGVVTPIRLKLSDNMIEVDFSTDDDPREV